MMRTLAIVLLLSVLALASDVVCPYHPQTSSCYPTGQFRYYQGVAYQVYRCTCGDAVLVRE